MIIHSLVTFVCHSKSWRAMYIHIMGINGAPRAQFLLQHSVAKLIHFTNILLWLACVVPFLSLGLPVILILHRLTYSTNLWTRSCHFTCTHACTHTSLSAKSNTDYKNSTIYHPLVDTAFLGPEPRMKVIRRRTY